MTVTGEQKYCIVVVMSVECLDKSIEDRARKAINKVIRNLRRLNPNNQRVVVALSGGSDSIALLYCASRAFDDVLGAHVRHDIRSEEETAVDLAIARQAAQKCQVDFLWRNVPVVKKASKEKRNLEKYARECRYAALAHMMQMRLISAEKSNFVPSDTRIIYGTHWIDGLLATGHHADDQLETLIMRLCRGAGLRGMSGIVENGKICSFQHTSGTCIRPMLCITREDTEAICRANDLPWATDSTNSNTDLTRNLIRAEIMPLLKRINPRCSEHAQSFALASASAAEMVQNRLSEMTRHEVLGMNLYRQMSCDALRLEEDVVIAEWLGKALEDRNVSQEPMAFDRVNTQMFNDVVMAIRGRKSKKFLWPCSRAIQVTPEYVRVHRQTQEDHAWQTPAKEE